MIKKGVILTGGYSDCYCKRPLYFMYLSGFIFTVLYIQLSSLLPQEQVYGLLAGYLQCKVRLMHCMVLLYWIWRGFEAIVMFECCSDSLDFLLIHSLYTTAEPA